MYELVGGLVQRLLPFSQGAHMVGWLVVALHPVGWLDLPSVCCLLTHLPALPLDAPRQRGDDLDVKRPVCASERVRACASEREKTHREKEKEKQRGK